MWLITEKGFRADFDSIQHAVERAVGWPTSEVNILTAAQVAGLTGDEIRSLVVELHLKRKSVFSTLMEV